MYHQSKRESRLVPVERLWARGLWGLVGQTDPVGSERHETVGQTLSRYSLGSFSFLPTSPHASWAPGQRQVGA